MSLFKTKPKANRLKLSQTKQHVLIVSDPISLRTHIAPVPGFRTMECTGDEDCLPCFLLYDFTMRHYFMCRTKDNEEAWFEIGDRLVSRFDGYETTVGLQVAIWKDGKAPNSPIDIKIVGEKDIPAKDCGAFFSKFSLPPERCSDHTTEQLDDMKRERDRVRLKHLEVAT